MLAMSVTYLVIVSNTCSWLSSNRLRDFMYNDVQLTASLSLYLSITQVATDLVIGEAWLGIGLTLSLLAEMLDSYSSIASCWKQKLIWSLAFVIRPVIIEVLQFVDQCKIAVHTALYLRTDQCQ